MLQKKILIVGFTENRGGLESYIMEIYRHCNHQKIQFDFLCFKKIHEDYEQEIHDLGGKVFYIPIKRNGVLAHYRGLKEIFSNCNYAGIYYQCNRKLSTLDVFKFAKKYNVPIRAIHSHNSTQQNVSFINKIRNRLVDFRIDNYVTDRFACSAEAGEWMFGNREYTVIKNAVDTSVFYYNKNDRIKTRKQLGLENKIIIGTVGRLAEQKNPFYIVEIMKQLCDMNKDIYFIHIGGGELEEKLKEKILEYSLQNNYLMLGMRNNIYSYLNAMDILVLPSKHEGFPIVLVEAQATGLKCLVADNITRSCDLTGNLKFLPINISAREWAEEILNELNYERQDCRKILVEKGYDIKTMAFQMQDFFLNGVN